LWGVFLKFKVLGEDTKIEIEAIGRKYPNTTDYWDINWLVSTINVNIPGYKACFNASLTTYEIRDFYTELTRMETKLKGQAKLNNIDGYLDIECEMNRTGRMMWSAELCYPAGHGALLSFDFESDQSYLGDLIKQLEQLLRVYPVIGKP
jgi:hypothetical protein